MEIQQSGAGRGLARGLVALAAVCAGVWLLTNGNVKSRLGFDTDVTLDDTAGVHIDGDAATRGRDLASPSVSAPPLGAAGNLGDGVGGDRDNVGDDLARDLGDDLRGGGGDDRDHAPGAQQAMGTAGEPPVALSAEAIAVGTLLGPAEHQAANGYRKARELRDAGRVDEAVVLFEAYAAAVPVLADVALSAAGDALLAAGRPVEAAARYAAAAAGDGDPSTRMLAAIRRGNALLQADQPGEAAAAYQMALEISSIDTEQAQALSGAVVAFERVGDAASALEARRRLVTTLPSTEPAREALRRLEATGQAVDVADVAAVMAGAGEHEQALARLDAAIAEDLSGGAGRAALGGAGDTTDSRGAPSADVTAADAPEVIESSAAIVESRRMQAMGIAWRAGFHAQVIALAEEIIAHSPTAAASDEAHWLRARAMEQLGQRRSAIAAFQAAADVALEMDRSAEALWRRAWLVEAEEGLVGGAGAFAGLAQRWPRADRGREAAFRAGLLAWRSGRRAEAEAAWTAALADGGAADVARARFWLGRLETERGSAAAAAEHWRMGAAADRDGFYGLRANAAVGGDLHVPPGPTDGHGADAHLAHWLAADVGAGDGALQAGLDQVLPSWPVRRAVAWLALEEERAARRTLTRAIPAQDGDAARLIALALAAKALALPDAASSAATGALWVAPAAARLSAPAALLAIAWPDPYAVELRAAAEEFDVPIELMLALVRQESRFDAGAVSSAGARGLGQIMPGTGEGIAARLGMAGYHVDQLFDPRTSLRMGAHYLRAQLEAFGGRPEVALSAYNGGPRNAARWWDQAHGDIDLFVEIIDYHETRRYVRAVLEGRAIYQRLAATR